MYTEIELKRHTIQSVQTACTPATHKVQRVLDYEHSSKDGLKKCTEIMPTGWFSVLISGVTKLYMSITTLVIH